MFVGHYAVSLALKNAEKKASLGRRNMKVPENIEDLRRNIQVQLADMSRLLGMMSNDDDVVREARTSFLKLSVLIGRALDIELQ